MIRAADESDFAAGLAVFRTVWPRSVGSLAGWLHAVRAEPAEAQRRFWAAETDGRMVGWAAAAVDYESAGRPGSVRVSVLEEHRRRGLGGALLERCVAHLDALGVSRVQTVGQDDDASVAFVRSRGFRQTSTTTVSGVEPASVAPGVAPPGIELRPLAELDPRLVFALDAEASADIPNEDNDDFRFEQWHADYWTQPDVDLESSVAVLEDGVPVSYSLLHADGDRGLSGMTGTLRSHRGRGLAELAKRATLVNAAARGIRQAVTHNDETNVPMLRVNEKLGYRPLGSLIGWTRP